MFGNGMWWVLFARSYPILNLELLRRNQRRMSRSEIVNLAVPVSPVKRFGAFAFVPRDGIAARTPTKANAHCQLVCTWRTGVRSAIKERQKNERDDWPPNRAGCPAEGQTAIDRLPAGGSDHPRAEFWASSAWRGVSFARSLYAGPYG